MLSTVRSRNDPEPTENAEPTPLGTVSHPASTNRPFLLPWKLPDKIPILPIPT